MSIATFRLHWSSSGDEDDLLCVNLWSTMFCCVRKFSTAVTGAPLHVLLKFKLGVVALILSHGVSNQIMHQYHSSVHRWRENGGNILWSHCRPSFISMLYLYTRQMLPVAEANDRFPGGLSIMFPCVIAYEC